MSGRPTKGDVAATGELDERTLKVARFIAALAAEGFYGKLTISFQNGKILDMRTEQVLKIEDLEG